MVETFPSQASLATDAESLADQLRRLIASQPTKELLGYIYAGVLLHAGREPNDVAKPTSLLNLEWEDAQFLLEYVHAVLAGTKATGDEKFSERVCAEVLEISKELRGRSMLLAMAVSMDSQESNFGEATRDVIFRALSSWILIRGNRYQVLEEEFYEFALAVHDAALRKVYGAGASDIARGIQALADSIRHGHAQALGALERSMSAAEEFLSAHPDDSEVGERWRRERPAEARAASEAFSDLVQGGICCVSRHTSLPSALLQDLAYERGEDEEFFAPGRFCGTPLRTLPARKKPLIKIGNDYYITDPSFARDAAYRAILWNLLKRAPDYKEEFKALQKEMSETAFQRIFASQLAGASVFNETWYRKDGNWYENDTLVLFEDVLLLIEAKAGAAATIASPAVDFGRHAQSLNDLIVKAYEQCRRFLEHLSSNEEVVLYRRVGGRFEELTRVRLGDYRLILPIGLTVESLSPFSTSSKQLPGVQPILGLHPFLSMSIDEILVLRRFLPTSGELFHYLRVRQMAAGIAEVLLFDELDHLGAYISKNIFTIDLERELAKGARMIVYDGAGDVIDDYFAKFDPNAVSPPVQEMPSELRSILAAVDQSRSRGFLKIDSALRDFGREGRMQVSGLLQPLRESLAMHPSRYALLMGHDGPVFFWLQRDDTELDGGTLQKKAAAAVVAAGATTGLGLLMSVDNTGAYVGASCFTIDASDFDATSSTVEAMKSRIFELPDDGGMPAIDFQRERRLGRNEPCWCGSGKKFKRCHG